MARVVWSDGVSYAETSGRVAWDDGAAHSETQGAASGTLTAITCVGSVTAFIASVAFALVAATATGAAADTTPTRATSLTAVASTGAAAPFAGSSPDAPLTAVAGTAAAAPFAFSGVFDGAFGSSSVGVFTASLAKSFAPAGATGAAAAPTGFSVAGPLAATAATTAVGEFDFTLPVTLPVPPIAATGAVGEFIVQGVDPAPGPVPGPDMLPVIVAPPHTLNWVWPRSGTSAVVRNAILLEDDGGALLLADGTPFALE